MCSNAQRDGRLSCTLTDAHFWKMRKFSLPWFVAGVGRGQMWNCEWHHKTDWSRKPVFATRIRDISSIQTELQPVLCSNTHVFVTTATRTGRRQVWMRSLNWPIPIENPRWDLSPIQVELQPILRFKYPHFRYHNKTGFGRKQLGLSMTRKPPKLIWHNNLGLISYRNRVIPNIGRLGSLGVSVGFWWKVISYLISYR